MPAPYNYVKIPEPSDPGYEKQPVNASKINAIAAALDEAIGAAVSTLATTAKTLVGAANELHARANAVQTQVDVAHEADGSHKAAVIATDDLSNGSVSRAKLALLEQAIMGEVETARAAYASLNARLNALVTAGGTLATLTDGAAAAGQKVVVVDSTTGFLAGAQVAYTLAGGTLEVNTIATVDSSSQLTLAANIGTGGIADDTYVSLIQLGALLSTGAIPGASASPQEFTQGITVAGHAIRHVATNSVAAKVYCLGDSHTASGTYMATLQAYLGASWLCVNKGVGGETTTQILARTGTGVVNYGDAQYCVVLAGTNDVATGVAAATIKANLQAIYDGLAAAGVRVVAVTIPPTTGQAAGLLAVKQEVNTWILNTATNLFDRYDLYALVDDPADPGNLLPAYDLDSVHLTEAGYIAFATDLYNSVTWTARYELNFFQGMIGLNQSLTTQSVVLFEQVSATNVVCVDALVRYIKPGYNPHGVRIRSTDGTVAVAKFDTENSRLGINQDTPTAPLHIVGGSGTGWDATTSSSLVRLDQKGAQGNQAGLEFHAGKTAAGSYRVGRIYATFDANSSIQARLTITSRNTWDQDVDTLTVKNGRVGIGTTSPNSELEIVNTTTITGTVGTGVSAALLLKPGYTAATAQTVTRHNYLGIYNPAVGGAGPAAVTDACVLWFDAAAGAHKAVDGATTKTTPSGVDAWIKVNLNNTVAYIPVYLSKTA